MLDSKTRILDAAILRFSEDGYYKSSTKSIAKEADVSEALIFKYYKSKKGLLEAVVDEILKNRLPKVIGLFIDDYIEGRLPIETLDDMKTIIFSKVTSINEHIHYFKIIFLELGQFDEDKLHEVQQLINGMINKFCIIVEALQAQNLIRQDINSRTLLRSYIAMSNFMLLDANFISQNIDIKQEFEDILDLFLKGARL